MSDVKLVLIDPNPSLCHAFSEAFARLPEHEVVRGAFEQLPRFDCMVSPANSFGLMDGGVDGAITRYFGVQLMQRMQARILEEYLGEQPVGTSMIVETGHAEHPYLAHTPTMRVPMPIAMTNHVYLAMWAMLLAVRAHNLRAERKIEVVACPGLGTEHGRVPFEEAARQMALAWSNFQQPPASINWNYAAVRQHQVGYGWGLPLTDAAGKGDV